VLQRLFRQFPLVHPRSHFIERHTLDARSNPNVNHSALDLSRNDRAGLQPRRAESVDGYDGSCIGEARQEHGHAMRDLSGAKLQVIPNRNVIDQLGVQLRPRNCLFQDCGQHHLGGGVF
jgi:hypothetical protein